MARAVVAGPPVRLCRRRDTDRCHSRKSRDRQGAAVFPKEHARLRRRNHLLQAARCRANNIIGRSGTSLRSTPLAALQQQSGLQLHFRSAGRSQQSKLLSRHSSAAAPHAAAATTTHWIEGKDLSAKPQPKGNEVLLYTHTLCPFAQRVHHALLEKVNVVEGGRCKCLYLFYHAMQHVGCVVREYAQWPHLNIASTLYVFAPQGVPFQLVHIDLAARPHWFTSLSGLVPLVEFPEEEVHRESLDICRCC